MTTGWPKDQVVEEAAKVSNRIESTIKHNHTTPKEEEVTYLRAPGLDRMAAPGRAGPTINGYSNGGAAIPM